MSSLRPIIEAAITGMLNEYPPDTGLGTTGNTLCRVSGARKQGDSGRLIADRILPLVRMAEERARAAERDRIRNAINETPGAVRKWCLKETGGGHPGSWLAWQDVLNLLDAVGSGDAE